MDYRSAPVEENRPNLKRRARIMIALIILLLLMGVNLAIGTDRLLIKKVASGSMEPTLQISDVVLADRYAIPKRYDIVIVTDPQDSNERLIKRIIGMPSDLLTIQGGILYINGKEEYSRNVTDNSIEWTDMKVRVPSGKVFVMGDNRNNSFDSVNFGPIPETDIRGVMIATIWPPTRWSRVGKFE
ncbi:signal peptidase I [bacterium]|nr:signal peptidase I [bacterium]